MSKTPTPRARRNHQGPTQRRFVNFTGNEDDFTVAMMGALGFGTHAIQEKTGLTFCQVTYRLNMGGIKRADYRRGSSRVAKHALHTLTASSAPLVRAELKANSNSKSTVKYASKKK